MRLVEVFLRINILRALRFYFFICELVSHEDRCVFYQGGTIREDSHDLAHLSLAYPLCLMEKHFKVKNTGCTVREKD